jgi:hypothetical protein
MKAYNITLLVLFCVVVLPLVVAYALVCAVINALLWPLQQLWIVSGCARKCADFDSLAAQHDAATVYKPRPDDETDIPSFTQFPILTSDQTKVVLMGDSVLDDFVWLANPSVNLRMCVEDALEDQKVDSACVNLAVDQMSTFDFIRRSPQGECWECSVV